MRAFARESGRAGGVVFLDNRDTRHVVWLRGLI